MTADLPRTTNICKPPFRITINGCFGGVYVFTGSAIGVAQYCLI